MSQIIIDSAMTREQALLFGLPENCPEDVLNQMTIVDVKYISFDQQLHKGQVVIHRDLEKDIKTIFELALSLKFPITQVTPISDERFNWDDTTSMEANNTSAFNYRMKIGKPGEISMHGRGRAIDINPRLNPYIRGSLIHPAGSTYQPGNAGVLTADHPLVLRFKELGWSWGGDWVDLKDYQHFEKG